MTKERKKKNLDMDTRKVRNIIEQDVSYLIKA